MHACTNVTGFAETQHNDARAEIQFMRYGMI